MRSRRKLCDVDELPPETRYAPLGVDRIAYQVLGDGPLDLLYAPARGDSLDLRFDWPPLGEFLRRLASFSRLIMFDRRGSGASDPISYEAAAFTERANARFFAANTNLLWGRMLAERLGPGDTERARTCSPACAAPPWPTVTRKRRTTGGRSTATLGLTGYVPLALRTAPSLLKLCEGTSDASVGVLIGC